MITKYNIKEVLLSEPFSFVEDAGTFSRHYGPEDGGFDLAYNSSFGRFEYPEGVIADRNTTLDEHQQESFVVFLCVAQLFARGYQPRNLVLEGKNYSGNDKGFCDILVVPDNRNNKYKEDQYLIIECKTADLSQKEDEFRKHWVKTLRNGDQLFRYFNTYRKAKYLCLLAADFPEYTKDGKKVHRFENIYHIISLVDNDEYLQTDSKLRSFKQLREEQGGAEEFFVVWKQTYKQDFNTRGLLEDGIKPFEIGKKNYCLTDLKTVDEYSLEKKYNEFALILRKHTISSHENAFDKLINLFIAKIIDEKYNANQLELLWKGAAYDDYFSLQDRLIELYRLGMKEFFNDEVTFIENRKIDEAFKFLTSKADVARDTIKRYFRELKYFNNNPFAFLDVHNEQLFFQNAVILKDVITMLQEIYLTSNTDNQFLGDLFEGYLNKGVHQSEGQFFTPIPIVRFLISSLPIQNLVENMNAAPRAIDYACGAGHFLTEYARQVQIYVLASMQEELSKIQSDDERKTVIKNKLSNYYRQIVGIEKDYRLSKVSQVAAYMYGMDGMHIHFSDGLADIEGVANHSFNVLVANPPYAVSGFLETLSEEERQRFELSQYVSNVERNNAIETFFIERASQLLDSQGVATIVLPASILTKDRIYMRTRELILKKFDIVSIVCFGPNTFGQTNTSTVVLFLRRKSIEPDESIHLQQRVNEWFCGNHNDDKYYNDTENLDAYIKRMGYEREDYFALMRGELTESFLSNELVQEYVKALNIFKNNKNSDSSTLGVDAKRVRDNAQKYVNSRAFDKRTPEGKNEDVLHYTLLFIQTIEKEKLYYYMLAASNPQPVIVVQSPNVNNKDKDKEKKFLGYEWSNAKGKEGIHYLNTKTAKKSSDGEDDEDDTLSQLKGVEGIVSPLFNPLDLSDESKINTMIRKNYSGEDFEVEKELEQFVHSYNLTEMLDFSSVEFDKAFNTSVAFKLQFESKFDLVPLKKIVQLNPSKTEVKDLADDTLVSFVDMQSVSEKGYIADKVDKTYFEVKSGGYTYFAEDDLIIAKITPCMENGKCAIATGLTNKVAFGSSEFHVFRCSKNILNSYLFALLNTDKVRAYAQKNMTGSSGHRRVPESFYSSLEVPLPKMSIQKKIAEECAEIDEKFHNAVQRLQESIQKLTLFVNSFSGRKEKLADICSINADAFDPTKTPNEEYIYIDIDAVENGTGRINTNKKIIGINAPSRARRYARANSTIISTVRPNLKGFAFIEQEFEKSVYSTGFAILNSKDSSVIKDKLIYAQFMYSDALMQQMLVAMPKGQYPSINKTDIESFEIIIPDNQQQTIEVIASYEKEIEVARTIIESVPTRKQAILDKYLK